MNVRLQTWFPYSIQIALNGREWLRRTLAKQKINFILHGNKFLHIADYTRAQKLHASPWAKGGTDKQLSARVSRHLRLLRDHGLIRKLPSQRRYILTVQGQLLTTVLNAILAASTQQLIDFAA